MKIKQFLFLLVFCSLIVTNFTHPMDNSSDMADMTDLGVECWKVRWQNPKLLKFNIPNEAFRYCKAGYEKSKISTENIRNKLDDYLSVWSAYNLVESIPVSALSMCACYQTIKAIPKDVLDDLKSKIINLPDMSVEEAIKIFNNTKLDVEVVASKRVFDYVDPEKVLSNKEPLPFSSITNEKSLFLLNKLFHERLRRINHRYCSLFLSIVPKKINEGKGKNCFTDFLVDKIKDDKTNKNNILEVFSGNKTVLSSNENFLLDLYTTLQPLCFPVPVCITSCNKFLAICPTNLVTNNIFIYNLYTKKRLIVIYFENDKKCGVFTRMKFCENDSVLFLKNKDGATYTFNLPVNFMIGNLTANAIAYLYTLEFYRRQSGSIYEDYSHLNPLRTLLKHTELKKLPPN